ncbi:MAG: hypothetical protein ACM34I_13090 [bacterium]
MAGPIQILIREMRRSVAAATRMDRTLQFSLHLLHRQGPPLAVSIILSAMEKESIQQDGLILINMALLQRQLRAALWDSLIAKIVMEMI